MVKKILILVLILFLLPYVFISFSVFQQKVEKFDDLNPSDVAIVFGAHISETNQPTEILQERLDAAITLYRENLVETIVVSNTERAAIVMKNYLLRNRVPLVDIEIDIHAELTSDSCRYELEREDRSRIFLSQGFHLNRLLYLCQGLGIDGVAFPVEQISPIDRNGVNVFTRSFIRTKRFLREVLLSWPVLFGFYE